ncbi:hypothetical protein DPMN_042297 [Dreissena polymorpha]|uniref:Uncharacterized protein n=1 Tax=Dreissena polymorpha TaxID=45954 RepID=A0A9D4D0B0_DREPO|nr:hypothetical protein DPMN_042297 [Dreissena polymorpha]
MAFNKYVEFFEEGLELVALKKKSKGVSTAIQASFREMSDDELLLLTQEVKMKMISVASEVDPKSTPKLCSIHQLIGDNTVLY